MKSTVENYYQFIGNMKTCSHLGSTHRYQNKVCISAIEEVKTGGQQFKYSAGKSGQVCNSKISLVWWCMPVIPVTQEVKV
jgi:hypothetical protein